MARFRVQECVVDAMPELHATRAFAERHAGKVWMCFFNENQKGRPAWDHAKRIVQVNRTEALDLWRSVLRDRRWVLVHGVRRRGARSPRRGQRQRLLWVGAIPGCSYRGREASPGAVMG
jgi:pullulanase/glycogen debranching enzyme